MYYTLAIKKGTSTIAKTSIYLKERQPDEDYDIPEEKQKEPIEEENLIEEDDPNNQNYNPTNDDPNNQTNDDPTYSFDNENGGYDKP